MRRGSRGGRRRAWLGVNISNRVFTVSPLLLLFSVREKKKRKSRNNLVTIMWLSLLKEIDIGGKKSCLHIHV